ncbi:MAG: hypothetical protein C5B49_04465, partial [Bdellovibrio sp.]
MSESNEFPKGENEPDEHHRVSFSVDRKPAVAIKGMSITEALRLNGVEVPTLCYDPGIEPSLGTCRVCIVKKNGREVASCTQAIQEGDVIECQTPELKNIRQGVIELLFSEGNHFCPGCEKSGDCDLQGTAYKMGMSHSRFPYKFTHYVLDYRGEHLLLER